MFLFVITVAVTNSFGLLLSVKVDVIKVKGTLANNCHANNKKKHC